jgi:hypothetical protein
MFLQVLNPIYNLPHLNFPVFSTHKIWWLVESISHVGKSFLAPSDVLRNDPELLAEPVDSSVAGLMALLGVRGDPLLTSGTYFDG